MAKTRGQEIAEKMVGRVEDGKDVLWIGAHKDDDLGLQLWVEESHDGQCHSQESVETIRQFIASAIDEEIESTETRCICPGPHGPF